MAIVAVLSTSLAFEDTLSQVNLIVAPLSLKEIWANYLAEILAVAVHFAFEYL
ncbi:hypothetical protein [Nostoc sp. DSM 114160]